jgi:hypothetical protein
MKKSFLTYALALAIALLSASGNANAAVIPVGVEVVGTLRELQAVAGSAKSAILEQLESELSRAISATGAGAEKLNAAIQTPYLGLKVKLDAVFNIPNADFVGEVETLKTDITTSLANISEQLTAVSGKAIVINADPVIQLLAQYQADALPLLIQLSNAGGDLAFRDSDADGLSDFDEVYVFNTNPNQASTDGGLTDSEKILNGVNPITNEPIEYQDAQTAVVDAPSIFTVSGIELKKTETATAIVFEGTALPNSVITLYIYSTPIIVAVKIDASGHWTYSLDKELDNGQHEVYVATVDNSGKILAKSSPIPFIKTAEAATLDTQAVAQAPQTSAQFLQKYLWAIILVIFDCAIARNLCSSKLRNWTLDNSLPNTAASTSISVSEYPLPEEREADDCSDVQSLIVPS